MSTTNFVQHNPSAANQEPDSTFDSDSLTTGGIGTDAIMPSAWMNKRWYQDSTFVTAFAQMLAAKGYTTSDANLSTLASVLSAVVTDNDLKANMVSVAYAPNPVFDASLANGFRIILSGNVASSTLVNTSTFQILTFSISNPSSFSFVWPSNVLGALPIPTGAVPNDVTDQTFIVLEDGNAYQLNTMLLVLQAAVAANVTAIAANAAAIAAITPVKGQFTSPSGSLGSGGQTSYNTGIAVGASSVAAASVLSGTLSPILSYVITVQGGTIKLVISNTSSSTIGYGSLTWNYAII